MATRYAHVDDPRLRDAVSGLVPPRETRSDVESAKVVQLPRRRGSNPGG
ncbi:hypothetical protein DB32_000993 [Sandaracinus amylolyticus]|uniref:Uncharacterized protein n=2 Tax=Sandaracinus amylolyticus TaxID=927083 RepID=A0A0F6SDQ3_9BACT|nr:hypothetical protein DB32_000993 [Sandaracinus amylolyticus]